MSVKPLLAVWLLGSLTASAVLTRALPKAASSESFHEQSDWFLPGETTHGHYQIELKCQACHERGGEVRESSCNDCHGAALKANRDTHPKKKFDDPSNAHLLSIIDARSCIACHAEHEPERTAAMGVSVPGDFCWQCHDDVAEERPSHAGMGFDTCANAGCHNYHDNTALYESFLAKHTDEPDMLDEQRVPLRDLIVASEKSLTAAEQDGPAGSDPAHVAAWARSGHALAGVNCTGCHQPAGDEVSMTTAWNDAVPTQVCAGCHAENVDGWHDGLHGMRPASGLPPMTPGMARLPMKAESLSRQLDCNVCHSAHEADTTTAAAESCLSCHDDGHSLAWETTAHAALWADEISDTTGLLAGTGVSCATCHMPRDKDGSVEHNQSANLRPNEKMVRTVCTSCHGVQYSLDSLADESCAASCYGEPPTVEVKSIQMVADWFAEKDRKRSARKKK